MNLVLLLLSFPIFAYHACHNACQNKENNERKQTPSYGFASSFLIYDEKRNDKNGITNTAGSNPKTPVRTEERHWNAPAEQCNQWNQE